MKNFSNQYKKFLSKKAFSLTELSMVILIIGILIGGISQGIDLYKDFIKLNVKKLTLNSPAGRIPDLAAWYETTQEQFVTGSDGIGSTALKAPWNDINPQSTRKKNLSGRAYVNDNGIQGFKSIFFMWNYAFVNSDLMPQSELVSSEGNTIFFVSTCTEGFDRVCGSPFGISKTPYCRSGDQGGYKLTIAHMWNWFCYSVRGQTGVDQAVCGNYSIEKWRNKNRIMTFQNSASSMFIRIDGVEFAKNTSINASDMAIGGDPIQINIGCAGTNQESGSFRDFQGLMSEIILYNRPLSMKEIKLVEDYLSKKYSIPIER